MPPVKPMLAKAIYEVPRADGLLYEPKWDGFRCLVFRDGDEVELWSRTDRPLEPLLPRDGATPCGPRCPSGAWSTASWWSSPATGSTSTRCSCGCTPPSRG